MATRASEFAEPATADNGRLCPTSPAKLAAKLIDSGEHRVVVPAIPWVVLRCVELVHPVVLSPHPLGHQALDSTQGIIEDRPWLTGL